MSVCVVGGLEVTTWLVQAIHHATTVCAKPAYPGAPRRRESPVLVASRSNRPHVLPAHGTRRWTACLVQPRLPLCGHRPWP